MAWTKASRRRRGKEMTIDKTHEFEARRNRPVKYDRDLYKTVVGAMDRVESIRSKREIDQYAKRVKVHRKSRVEEKRRVLRSEKNEVIRKVVEREREEVRVREPRRKVKEGRRERGVEEVGRREMVGK